MATRHVYARGLSADAATLRLAAEYLLWFIPALALQFGLVAMASALRGTGNFRPGMVVQTATVILNIVLAPVLIFGWGTGIAAGRRRRGALDARRDRHRRGLDVVYFLPAEAYLRFSFRDWTPRFDLWRDMLKIGLPAGAEFALMAVYLMLVYAVSRPFGAAAQAGFGIGMRIIQACFLPVVALGFAVGPVAGQNFGARQGRARARDIPNGGGDGGRRHARRWRRSCGSAPAPMVGVFSPDPHVIAVGEEYLHIIAFNFVASGIIFVSSSMFQAMGNTMPSLITSFARIVIVAVPVLLLAQTRASRCAGSGISLWAPSSCSWR